MEEVETCESTLRRCLPRLQVRSVRPITEGWDSLVLEVNGEWIFRFPRRPEVEESLEKEIRLLPALAPALPLAVPRFEHARRRIDGCPHPFAGYRKIPGEALAVDRLSPGEAADVARRLGRFVTALQRFPRAEAVRLGVPDASPEEWREQYAALYAEVRGQVMPLLDPAPRLRLATLWEGFLQEPEHLRFEPVLLHRDLGGAHILFDPEQGRLTGIIDWGDASTGDPAFDFTGLLYDHGREFAAMAAAAYGGEREGTFWQRVEFYARIIPCYEILYGLRMGDEGHIQAGIERLGATLA